MRPAARSGRRPSLPAADAANPFRILPHAHRRRAAPAASHDQQALPAGADAGAAARLQSDLHRLRAHPRVRVHHHRALPLEECLAAVDECGAPMVSICGGEPMMYPADRRSWWPAFWSATRHIYLCTNGMFIKKRLQRVQRPTSASSSTCTWTAWRRPTTSRGARRRVPRSHRRHQGRQGRRLPGLHQHHGLQRDRHGRDRGAVRVPRSSSTWTAT